MQEHRVMGGKYPGTYVENCAIRNCKGYLDVVEG